jgi:hypothetical protein
MPAIQFETAHFALRWDPNAAWTAQAPLPTMALAQSAGTELEAIWTNHTQAVGFEEPFCQSTTKFKVNIDIDPTFGLTGGGTGLNEPGMWIGPGALSDHWGLAHEFTHALQYGLTTLRSSPYTGWFFENHANFMAHTLPEFHSTNVHCSELSVNFPHVYLGSTRVRYCEWQFLEYLKDKYCYQAVDKIWSAAPPVNTGNFTTVDPFSVIATNQGWTQSQLNDFFGEWMVHNVTWDYRDPDGTDQGPGYRSNYGPITDTAGHAPGAPAGFRRLRLTQLDPLDTPNRRFVTASAWAPQRWGYNAVQLFPDAGATSVTVTFRGVLQTGPANTNFGADNAADLPATIPNAMSDWRWGLVAVDATGTKPRYSALQRGSDGKLTFCLLPGDAELFLMVMATPTAQQSILWDQMYYTIYRYPWMVQVDGALPSGFQANAPNPTASGQRWPNGGGWVATGATVASTAFVGPFATVLAGNVSGSARIDGHAVIVNGTVSGNAVVDALTLLAGGDTVSGTAHVGTVFQGPGMFEAGQSVSAAAQILGDIELRGQGASVTQGVYYGFVDTTVNGVANMGANRTAPVPEVTLAGPYTWRP